MAAEDKLLEACADLSRTTPASATDSLLERLASAHLSVIGERRVLDEVKRRTRIPLSALATQLASYKRSTLPSVAPAWTSQIVLAASGEPCPIASNVLIALRNAPEWHSVLGLDEFRQRPMLTGKPPWANGSWKGSCDFTDTDENRTLIWIQEAGIHCRIDAVRQALSVVIDDNSFHPVHDYLNRLVWDGVPRIDTWLTYYMGVQPIPDYTGPIGARWLISGVARIFEPGCVAKYCLVLEGRQDLGKSAALRILGGQWFTDDIAELGTKDSAMQVGNAWIVELAELDSVRKAHIAATKAFISRTIDQFRKPFGRYVVTQPRQSIMAGTVNPSGEYLADDTGNVRFWVVLCHAIDLEALCNDRDQLWAEAVGRYRLGESWWLDVDEQVVAAQKEQSQRAVQPDTWEQKIARWFDANPTVNEMSVEGLLSTVMEIPARDQDRPAQTRVGFAMHKLGWTKFRESTGNRWWIYRRPVDPS